MSRNCDNFLKLVQKFEFLLNNESLFFIRAKCRVTKSKILIKYELHNYVFNVHLESLATIICNRL